MAMGMTSHFRGLDSDLPSIAALAAAEVDGLIRRQQSNLQNLGRLAEVLTTSFATVGHSGGARHLLDPVSVNVFASARRDALSSAVSSYDELADASLQLAEQMKRASERVDDVVLAQLKRFCLALSRYALANSDGFEAGSKAPDYKR
jgi:hypothetical protein